MGNQELKPAVYSHVGGSGADLGRTADMLLSGRRPDGSVPGSYDGETMEALLHYRNIGGMALGGEVS